jgi:hypothetical protein
VLCRGNSKSMHLLHNYYRHAASELTVNESVFFCFFFCRYTASTGVPCLKRPSAETPTQRYQYYIEWSNAE